MTYTGVQGQEKGNLAPSSRLAESCTFICQQPNHINSNTTSLEMFMAQIQSERNFKAKRAGLKGLIQGEQLNAIQSLSDQRETRQVQPVHYSHRYLLLEG